MGTPLISAFSNVTNISAPDDSHVTVTLAEPSLEFIYSMTAAIIPEGSGDGIAQNPVAPGPSSLCLIRPRTAWLSRSMRATGVRRPIWIR